MYSFLGNIESKVDEKGRLFFPAQYRKQLDGESNLVLRLNDNHPFLDIYPESVWQEEVALIESKLDLFDPIDQLIYMQHTSSAAIVKLDSNGRILVPKKHLEKIELTDDAVFIGTTKKIALWSKSKYNSEVKLSAELAKLKLEKLTRK